MRATIAALVLCCLLATPVGAATLSTSAAPAPEAAHQSPAPEAGDAGQFEPASVEQFQAGAAGEFESGGVEQFRAGGVEQPVAAAATGGFAQSQGEQGLSTPETIDVQIREDGHARFTVTKEYPAETEAERAAFERVAEEFERGDRELGLPFFSTVVEDVSEETGRPMELTATSRRTPVEDGTGRLIQQFTWTNYAAVTEDRVEIQDGFQTDDGVWLHSLEADQQLVLRAPDGYGVAHSEPKSSVRGNSVIWEGPQTFQRGDFQTVFERGQSPFGNGIGDASLLLGAIGLLLLLVTGYLLVQRLQREGVLDGPALPVPSRVARSIPGSGSEQRDPTGGADQPSPDGAGAGAADASEAEDAGGDEATDAGAAEDEAVDPELLSDEERVERLLERNGGRMKQAKIVDETGWSNAKVSQLLSEMAEEEKVDKLRIGRENLITLPDEDVTAME